MLRMNLCMSFSPKRFGRTKMNYSLSSLGSEAGGSSNGQNEAVRLVSLAKRKEMASVRTVS